VQRALLLHTAARGKRRVDEHVARVAILDEEHDVGHCIEQRFEQREMRDHLRDRRSVTRRRQKRFSHD
jgi:hypothetical protein